MKYFALALITSVKKYWIYITLFVLTAITVLSLTPLESLPPAPGSDKTHHFIAYATLMFPTAMRKPKHLPLITLFFIGWSGIIELLQPYINRYGEFKDLLANIGGLGCGLLLVWIMQKMFPLEIDSK